MNNAHDKVLLLASGRLPLSGEIFPQGNKNEASSVQTQLNAMGSPFGIQFDGGKER